ncbi:MAG: hypothetical protein IJT44_00430 [Clostridia bacterium]|nr:hypothetical protein [Clostridia bacterium]
MTWLYVLTKTVFFPGTFLKGFWEHLICRALNVQIFAADAYITRNRLCGHVSMMPAPTARKSFFVCFWPMVLNFLIGFPAFSAGAMTLGFLGVDVVDPLTGKFCPLFLVYVLLYLFGASCLCSLFPVVEDAVHMWRMHYGHDSKAGAAAKVFAFLPACVMTAGAYLEKYSVTFLLSVAFLVYWIVT